MAKQCVNYGRRVQNSVFECILDNAQSIALKATLEDIIDTEKDSLRFYYLGNKYQTKIEHIGVDRGIAWMDTDFVTDAKANIKCLGFAPYKLCDLLK